MNLVKNPSFEDGLTDWQVPGWIAHLYKPQIDHSVVSGGGSASLKMQGESGKWGCVMQTMKLPGGNYECSVNLKNSAFRIGWTAFLMLEYRLPDGAIVNAFRLGSQWNKPDNDWMQLEKVFVLPDDCQYLRIYLMSRSSQGDAEPENLGIAWFDNVSLRRINPLSVAQQLEASSLMPGSSDPRSINLVPGLPGFSSFKRVSWIKDSTEHEVVGERLLFRAAAGKRGYSHASVTPPMIPVAFYEFTVHCERSSMSSDWVPVVQVEELRRKDGVLSYHYTKGLSEDGTVYRVLLPHDENLRELRLILGSTVFKGNDAEAAAAQIVFTEPRLSVIARNTGHVLAECARPAQIGGIYQPGDEVNFDLQLYCGLSEPCQGRLECEVLDVQGRSLNLISRTEQLSPGSYVSLRLKPRKRFYEPGYYLGKCRFVSENNALAETTTAFVVAAWLERPDPFFAMCHFGLPDTYLPATRAMGMGSCTLAVYQNRCEPEPGKYDFTAVERSLTLLQKHGLQAFGHLPIYANPYDMDASWYNKIKKEHLDKGWPDTVYEQFGNYVQALFKQVGRRVNSWSIVNEIDLSHHRGKFAEDYYIACTRIASRQLRKVANELPLLALCVSGVDSMRLFPYAKKLYPMLEGYVDGIGPDAHVTPCTYGPGYKPISEEKGFFRETLLEARQMVGKNGLVSIEEKGYVCLSDLPMDAPALFDLAAVMQRGVVMAKGHGVLRWVPHYAMTYRSSLSDYGMWRNGNPRPMIATYAAAARILVNADNPIEILPLQGIYAYIFQRGQTSVAALWTSEKESLQCSLVLPEDSLVYDMFGSRYTFDGTISDRPIFIETSCPQAELAELLAKADYSLPALAGELSFVNPRKVRVSVLNKSNDTMEAKLSSASLPSLQLQLPAAQISNFFVDLNAPLPQGEALQVELSTQAQLLQIQTEYFCHSVKKLEQADLSSLERRFSELEPIELNGVSSLLPVDAAANGLWQGVDDLSLKIYLAYDDDFFYIAALVRDDRRVFKQSGSNLWNQDAMQFAFDCAADAHSDKLASPQYDADNDWEYVFAMNKENKPELYCYTAPAHCDGSKGRQLGYPMQIEEQDGQHMLYKLALPWRGLAPLAPVPGRIFGFNLIFFDDDGEGPLYEMGLSPGISGGKNPFLFKKFVFE